MKSMRNICAVIVLCSLEIQALPEEGSCGNERNEENCGSCVGYRFPGENSNAPDMVTPIDSPIILRTLRQDVPVYQGEQTTPVREYLDFDIDVKPIKQTSQRIQVIKGYAGTPLGWIEKRDLLCQGGGQGANAGPLKVKG